MKSENQNLLMLKPCQLKHSQPGHYKLNFHLVKLNYQNHLQGVHDAICDHVSHTCGEIHTPKKGEWEVKHNQQPAVCVDNLQDNILSSRRKTFKYCNAICADTLWFKKDDLLRSNNVNSSLLCR